MWDGTALMSHCFGECGEAKLVVSVSFGTRAPLKWKGKSCSNSEARSCWLDHGDVLIMDGQCQDEFLHCTDPGLEQERINIAFRWIKRRVATCPFLGTGVDCCLPAWWAGPFLLERCLGVALCSVILRCPRGSVLFKWEVLALLVYLLMCTGLWLRRCAPSKKKR